MTRMSHERLLHCDYELLAAQPGGPGGAGGYNYYIGLLYKYYIITIHFIISYYINV